MEKYMIVRDCFKAAEPGFFQSQIIKGEGSVAGSDAAEKSFLFRGITHFQNKMAGGFIRTDLPDDALVLLLERFIQHLCRSEEHTSELQSLMRISYAVFCLKKKTHYSCYVD